MRRLADRPELVAHDVVTRAVRETGTQDFGGVAWSEPLEVLTRSLETEARLNQRGRRWWRDRLVGALASRVHLPAGPPTGASNGPRLVVVGLPGSTVPLALTLESLRELHHEPDPFRTGFVGLSWEVGAHVPSYSEWLAEADLSPTYAAASTGTAPVVAGSVHLERVAHVAAVFPDAVIVHVRRAVDDAVASTAASSYRARREHCDDIDETKVRRYWAWRIGLLADRGREGLDAIPSRVLEVDWADVAADRQAVAGRIWAELG